MRPYISLDLETAINNLPAVFQEFKKWTISGRPGLIDALNKEHSRLVQIKNKFETDLTQLDMVWAVKIQRQVDRSAKERTC